MSLNTKKIKEANITADPASVLLFLKSRYYQNTDDEVLNNARILNPFRELDKTSAFILSQDYTLEQNLLARFINRLDVLKIIDWNDPIEWLNNYKGAVTNSGAYQLHGAITAHRLRTIRQLLTLVWEKAPDVIQVVKTAPTGVSLKTLTHDCNKAMGGGALFALFQFLLDYGWLYDGELLDTEPYVGAGGKMLNFDLGELQNYINANWKDKPRDFNPYDVENALCEYRKYVMWTRFGIPNNRKRKK